MSSPASRRTSRSDLLRVNNNRSPNTVSTTQIQGEEYELVDLTGDPNVLIHIDPLPPPQDFNEELSETRPNRPLNFVEEPPPHAGPSEMPIEAQRSFPSNVLGEPDQVFIAINRPPPTEEDQEPNETQRRQTSDVMEQPTYVVVDLNSPGLTDSGNLLAEVTVEDVDEASDNLTVLETPDEVSIGIPAEIPVTLHDVLKAFDDALEAELHQWENRYLNDPDGAFKQKIDSYVDAWVGSMQFKDAGLPEEELLPLFAMLGSKLADAYGLVNPATGDWSEEVKTVADRAGAEYARPSVKAFMWTQLPSFLKSAIGFYTSLFADERTASMVKHVTNFVYPFIQVPAAIWAAQNNAYEQSGAVQQQKRELSTSAPSPAVESSRIINVDGTPGELRPLAHVHEDLEELKEASELIKSGDQRKLEEKRGKIAGEVLLARGALQTMLAHMTAALGTARKLNPDVPFSDKEEAVLNEALPLEVRVGLLVKFTSGRAAVPGPERLRAKRLLKQLKQWNMLQNEIGAAIGSVTSGVAPEVSEALRKAVVDTRFERMQTVLYRMLNVLSNQAIARDLRTAFFMGSTLTQLSGQVAEYVTGNDGSLLASDALQGFLTLVQTLVYAVHYPKATAWDGLNKLATQFQIIAMTGPGNFLEKDGKTIDPKKLDKVVTGPVQARVSTIESLLKFDKTVYEGAVLAWLLLGDKPQTLDNDRADKVHVLLPGAREAKEIRCTYAALSAEFGELKTTADRKAFVDQIAEQRPRAMKNKEKIDRNLELYEANEVNLENKRNMSKLLDERTSMLPDKTREMFLRSLGFVVKTPMQIGTRKELLRADRKVFEKAGEIEMKSDKNFQPSQKLGQALAWFVAGTTGFLALRSIMNLAVELAIVHGELTQKAADALAADILAGKVTTNIISLASLIFALGLNHAYQDYIAQKALQRQNAAALGGASVVNAPLPTLHGGIWQEFLAVIGREDAREEEVTGYETLVGTPIPKNDWPKEMHKFLRPMPIMETMAEQMFATDLKSWPAYFKEKHGELEGKTADALEKDMQKHLKELRDLLKAQGVAKSADDAGDANTSRSDASKQEIEQAAVPPKVPPLTLPASMPRTVTIPKDVEVATPRSPRRSPRNLRKEPLAPSLAAAAQNEKKRQEEALGVHKRRHPLYTGVSVSGIVKRTHDPEFVVPLNYEEEEGAVSESEDMSVPPETQQMRKLDWRTLDSGISVAREGPIFYMSRPPKHENPIEAFSVPGVDNSNRLHLSNRKFPSLAVNNMLQLDLGGNRNWNTLATDDQFAQFFHQHLHNPAQPEPMRLAEMRMQDLATFTQQMALESPEARWYPMTTTTVRYMPGADQPIRSDKAPPPALWAGQSFGVSYDGQDSLGNLVQGSVLLSYDPRTGFYSIIAPTSREPIATKASEPMNALQSFMEMPGTAHRNLPDTTFTVLYHVPPQYHPGRDNEEVRQRVDDEKGNAEALAWTWIAHHDGNAFKARGNIEQASRMLEEENSYLLCEAYFEGRPEREIAALVATNRKAIERLSSAYAHLVVGLDTLSI